MDKTVYLAGPVGDVDDPHGWRNVATEHLNEVGVNTLDPLDKYDGTLDELIITSDPEPNPPEGVEVITSREIVESDMHMIRSSDLLLARYDPDVHMIGTPMEIFYASFCLDMPVVVWHDDVWSNPLPHPWIDDFGDLLCPDSSIEDVCIAVDGVLVDEMV